MGIREEMLELSTETGLIGLCHLCEAPILATAQYWEEIIGWRRIRGGRVMAATMDQGTGKIRCMDCHSQGPVRKLPL